MDELVHHCLRELSFDGDLGSNVSRLRDFILGFYTDQPQLVDDAFCAFVWSVVVQQPSVRVGTLPPGCVSQVHIAPQTSAKRKAAAKGEEVLQGVPPSLVPVQDARNRHLDDLKREYGDHLRIAVDPETSFAAITGSHIRPPKLSPMVYSALQLITRGREDGITTVELGRKTGYDQKTCFYLIKQLVELGLVIKARRGGVGNHTCIHRYFIERSPLWQRIQEETRNGQGVPTIDPVKPCDTVEEATDQPSSFQTLFDPIDSRHLSSLPLVRNRIVRLLRESRNHIHQSNNLLTTIGFVHPTKTDRRFFQTRLRELIQQGVVERVLVPSSKASDRTIKCIRLVTPDNQFPDESVVVGQDVEEDERDPSLAEDAPAVVGHNEVKANLTIHKQVSDMLEEAGPSGLTLNEICVALGNFDKRTIELLLTRASNNRPPSYLGDLGTVDLMETYGRERRHRYFTLAAYECVMASEQLQPTTTTITDVDLSRVGDFAALDPKHFYTSAGKLRFYQDSFKDITAAKGKKRKRDERASDEEASEPLPEPKRGRPRKTPGLTNASVTTSKKRGRPRKNTTAKEGETVGTTPGGFMSERTAEFHTAGQDQAIASATPTEGQAIVISLQADEASTVTGPDSVQFEQSMIRPSVGSSLAPATGNTPGTMHVVKRPTSAPQARLSLARCDLEDGISHQVIGDMQPYHSPKAASCDLSRRAETNALNMNNYPITKSTGSGAMALGSPLFVEKGDSPGKSLISVTLEEGHTSVSTDSGSMQMTRRESLPIPSCDVVTGEKHKDVTLPPSSRPWKRSRTDGSSKLRSNINISSLRRENELFKVIENMGGIANMHSKDVFEAHAALLDVLSQAKEPTSAPSGARLDKRTAESAFKSLESRGRIKMLKTFLTAPSGVSSRPACLVYFPDTPQEKVNAFLRQLSQSVPLTVTGSAKLLGGPVEYGPSISSRKAEETDSVDTRSVKRRKAEEARAKRKRDQGNSEVRSPATGPPPVVPNPPEKLAKCLVERQDVPAAPVANTKRKGKAKEESEVSRRPRVHWTREFDELARDASAIIRARCRTTRLDLSALDQVFPTIPRNSVRQRIMHLRDNPVDDLYLRRLEDQWYTVWLQHRGTPHLPDQDPSSPSNFNLMKHIEFLRSYVDKNALRVGFMEREAPSNLPHSVKDLRTFYEVTEEVASAPAWDFMWGTTVEENREKQFRSHAFSREPDCLHGDTRNEKGQFAEAALKMVFATPGELYDPDSATRLLHSAGDQCVSAAKSNLLRQGVLSKLVRDLKKPKPGRMLKISDTNLSGIGGPFPRDLFQDATSLEELIAEKVVDEMEWPLITSEGDIATLLHLVSEDQVDFTVDLSQSQATRQKIDWNSKRADDEDIETGIRLRFTRTSVVDSDENRNHCYESPTIDSDPDVLEQDIHGTTLDGKEAACSLKTESGFINCFACLNTTFAIFTSSLGQSDRDLARRIFDNVRRLKETGLSKAMCLCLEAGLERHLLWLVHKMTLTSPPILFWIYFNTPVLVAGDYCGAWSVIVSDEPLTLITPRRWLDLRGYRLDGAWGAAQRAVVGVIYLHPGISQAELRWRLRAVYDRQEIIDLLSSLLEDSVLECRTDARVETIRSLPGWLKALDDGERILWFIAKNHRWYRI